MPAEQEPPSYEVLAALVASLRAELAESQAALGRRSGSWRGRGSRSRERQVPGCGQNLDGADLVPETHLRVVTTTLRGKYMVVALRLPPTC